MRERPTRKSRHRRTAVAAGAADERPSTVRRGALTAMSRLALVASIAAWVLAGLFGVVVVLAATGVIRPSALPSGLIGLELLPTATVAPTPTVTPTPTAKPPSADVAILAGHWSHEDPQGVTTVHDTGALCDDGLREVNINKAVADKVVALMLGLGYRVDLLEEFDAKLKTFEPDYSPRVFVAIHSDSCVHGPDFPFATGYKIAHAEPSDVPEQDDRLVACLQRNYDPAVRPYRMTFNENTITTDMTAYHAFREIVPTTPAAIIELGFMYSDRVVLTTHQDELAVALANGLGAFLKGERCGLPEPSPEPPPAATPGL